MILQVHAKRWVFPDSTNPHVQKRGGFNRQKNRKRLRLSRLSFRVSRTTSCTTAPVDMVVHPIVGRVFYISGGAGFLPSRVCSEYLNFDSSI